MSTLGTPDALLLRELYLFRYSVVNVQFLFRLHSLLHKKVLRPVYPQIRKMRKKIPISEISETGTFTLKLFFLQYLC